MKRYWFCTCPMRNESGETIRHLANPWEKDFCHQCGSERKNCPEVPQEIAVIIAQTERKVIDLATR